MALQGHSSRSAPEEPRERPERAPRRPQERAQRRPTDDSRHSSIWGEGSLKLLPSSGVLQDGSKSVPEPPESALRWPEEAPREPQ
eukprot:7770877-Pyramimonas_sp.AAC.1